MSIDLQNYLIIISFIVFAVVCIIFLYRKNSTKSSDNELKEKSIDGLNFQIDLLKKEIESKESLHKQEIVNKENLIDEKEKNFQSLLKQKEDQISQILKEKQEQIENLKIERNNIVEQLKEYLGKEFKNTSNQTLDNVSHSFRKQFENYFENKNKITTQNIEEMINPIEQLMNDLKSTNLNFVKTYKEDFTNFGSVLSDVKSTHEKAISETSKLTNALKGSSQSAGRWGEEKLKNILDMMNMSEGVDYEMQTTTDEDGLRPDCIVNIPGDLKLAVDSKVSIQDYLSAMESNDEAEKNIYLQKNAAKIRNHMQTLSKKEYFKKIKGSLPEVLMFIPEESIFYSSLQNDKKLYQDSLKSNIIIVGPTGLLMMVTMIKKMWSSHKQSKEVSKIVDIGAELFKRFQTMSSHIVSLGDSIEKTSNNYNKFIGSMDSKVLPKFEEISKFYPSTIKDKNKKPKFISDSVRKSSKLKINDERID